MKKVILLLLLSVSILSYCAKYEQIGQVNMISNRNINPALNYKLISTFAGSAEKEIKKSKSETIEDAIEKTVMSVPGGEFLMNVKIYLVDNRYYAVQGDVWGNAENESFKGFSVGDVVLWKSFSIQLAKFVYRKGKIIALKNDEKCLLETFDTGKTIEVEYNKLSKSEE